MGTGGTFKLMVCNDVSSKFLNALQLGKITNRYTTIRQPLRWRLRFVAVCRNMRIKGEIIVQNNTRVVRPTCSETATEEEAIYVNRIKRLESAWTLTSTLAMLVSS